MFFIDDGEFRFVGLYLNSGIDVLIVGIGFVGFMVVIECVRKGYNVWVLERNDDINIVGMFFCIFF